MMSYIEKTTPKVERKQRPTWDVIRFNISHRP